MPCHVFAHSMTADFFASSIADPPEPTRLYGVASPRFSVRTIR